MNTTIPKLLHDDSSRRVGTFIHYFRMPEPLFNKLLEMVTPITQKQDTQMRPAIDPRTRLSCTLRYLATGETMSDLHYQFRLGI